jgi:hypothetical protein
MALVVQKLFQDITSAIISGNADELYDSLFHVESHTATMILTKNFHRFSEDQVARALQHIFFEIPDDREKLDTAFGYLSLDDHHYEYTDSAQLFGRWLMHTNDADFQKFLSALSEDISIDGTSKFRNIITWFL